MRAKYLNSLGEGGPRPRATSSVWKWKVVARWRVRRDKHKWAWAPSPGDPDVWGELVRSCEYRIPRNRYGVGICNCETLSLNGLVIGAEQSCFASFMSQGRWAGARFTARSLDFLCKGVKPLYAPPSSAKGTAHALPLPGSNSETWWN